MNRKTLFVLLTLFTLLFGGTISAQEVTTVTWWTEDYVDIDALNALLVEPFNAANPSIKLEVIPQTSLDEAVRTAFAAGSAPDILQTPGASFIGEFVDAGLVYPLSSAAAELGWQEKLLPWAYESGILNGELYSIPLTFESMILMYNKTLFEENGWTAPTTFEELQAIAEAAQAQGINPFGYGNSGFQPANEHVVGVYLNNYAGAENVYAALTGEKSWTDPEFAEAIELLRGHMADVNWFNDSLETWFAYGWNEQWTALSTRESAMMIIGTWGFRGADEFFGETTDEWDWAPIPPFSSNLPEYNYMLATGSTLSVNGQSANPEAAIAVLDFLYSDPARVLQIASGYNYGEFVVPLKFAAEDFPEGTDERIARFYADFGAVTAEGRVGYTTWTFWPADADVQLWQEIENVWYGEMTVETYLANHQAVWDEARADGAVPPIPTR
ncbi:MAG TPA: extracellular solute-binding protein [Aggregatilineales bacterium]|nr:extracellular solute-binding protein [Anaerolineae bacterium]HUN10473.1 extracellular solute-binding protein [Aggregatilineales bacterium]